MPQDIFPESFSSSASSTLNSLLKLKLREHGLVLRKLAASLKGLSNDEVVSTLRTKKEELMGEIYRVMTATLGVPPPSNKPFTWDYYDKDGKPHTWTGTPLQFYKVRSTILRYFSNQLIIFSK